MTEGYSHPLSFEASFVQGLVLDPATTPDQLAQWRNSYLQRNGYFPTKLQKELLGMVVSTLPASDSALELMIALNGGEHAGSNADLAQLLGTLLEHRGEQHMKWADLITSRYPRSAGWLAIDGQYLRHMDTSTSVQTNPELERVWARMWRGGLQRYRRYSPMTPKEDRKNGAQEAAVLVGMAVVGQALGWNVPMTRATAQSLKRDIASLMPDGLLMWMPGSSVQVKELEQAADSTLAQARMRDLREIAQSQAGVRRHTTKRGM